MPQNCLFKFYIGEYIFQYGKPHAIITGWEEQDGYHGEIFIIFENFDSTTIRKGQMIQFPKLYKNVSEFLHKECYPQALNIIFYKIIFEMISERGKKPLPEREIKLYEMKGASLIFLKSKYEEDLNWIYKYTQCEDLKGLIEITKKLIISVKDFPQN